jgi:hypothetical protein
MAYVKSDRDALQKLKIPDSDKFAEFSSNNKAQVTEEEANRLVETYSDIHHA